MIGVNTQDANNTVILTANCNRGEPKRLPFFVVGYIANIAAIIFLLKMIKDRPGHVADRRVDIAACILAIDDLYHRPLHVFQAVQNKFIIIP